jgi:trehalose 6-phosphate synthase/phosphatase
VSSLRDVRESLWLGWSGLSDELPPDEARQLDERLSAMNLVPVPLSADEVERYYEGFCNGLLWPLFHYLIGQIPLEIQDLGLYETINARFAEAVVQHYRPGDLIWVHDYQLMLVPEMVRERLPDARIGFFLHIPFPAPTCSAPCPSAIACCAACWARTWWGSTPSSTCATSPPRCCARWG